MKRTTILLFACLTLAFFVAPIKSANILGLFITSSKSHLIIHTAISDALAERGHNITVVTTIPLIKKNPQYRHIYLDVSVFPEELFTNMIKNSVPWYKQMNTFIDILTKYNNESLNHQSMRKLMDEETFDLVVYGYFFNDFLLGVAGHFKCPVVISYQLQPFGYLNKMIGNPSELAYVPCMLGGKQPLGFIDRITNFLVSHLLEDGLMKLVLGWYMDTMYNSNFPSEKYPSLSDMKKNVSLILTNHHFSQTPIRPNVPALIEIGGIQIKNKPDPLPKNLQTILDDSSKQGGTIYFSLGSIVKGSHLDKSKAKIMFDVLSKLPHTVICKWVGSDFPGQSPNIIYESWLPQDDILAHPNVKLFITHGGQGSVVESQYHGVPMVGIPLFAEQATNMKNVVKSGYGLAVDYSTLSEEALMYAITEVLSNTKYRQNIQNFVKLYKDRPMTAKETAVFWLEYVIRHRGASHLQSPAVHLYDFQLMSLDIIAFLMAAAYVAYKAIKVIFLLILRRKSRNAKNKKE